tara:strand:+ start:497 stop:1120 length:624 start_codon:yes stop_codon:yes gene_type:complete
MKKLFATAALIAAFIISPMASAGVSGSVGLESDRFWRGMNMSDGTSLELDLMVDYEGWFAGGKVMKGASSLGHEMSDELNTMVYAGYGLSLTDDWSVRAGIVSYDWDMLPESFEEAVVGGSYKGLDLDYYMNVDNSDSTYLELGYTLPYISVVDLELNYGRFDDGEDVVGLTISKDVGQWGFSLMVLEEARHGEFMDSASLGFHYNF